MAESKRLTKDMLPWEKLAKIGITEEKLLKTNNLENLLQGRPTSLISLIFSSENITTKGDAKLFLYKDRAGDFQIKLTFKKSKPSLNLPVFKTYLNETQKKNLLDTGNAGEIIKVNVKDDVFRDMIISIDKDTLDIVHYPVDLVSIPTVFGGVEFTSQQQTDLLTGKAVFVENIKRTKDNALFNAHLQYSAATRKLEFVFPKNKPEVDDLPGATQGQEKKKMQRKRQKVS